MENNVMVIGKFWNDDYTDFVIGYYGGKTNMYSYLYQHNMVTEKGELIKGYINFEKITTSGGLKWL